MYRDILYSTQNRIARITINRPKVMNALNPSVLAELNTAFKDAEKDDDVAVVVITGAGKAFTAGADLTSLGENQLKGGRLGSIADEPARELINTILNMPKVVIGMINGYCITCGMELMLSFDLVIASEDAAFADTHVRWGLRPYWGMSQRLPGAVGILKAKEMAFTADMISAEEAGRIGLVNMVVPHDKLEETTMQLANKILANSRDAIAACKYLYNRGVSFSQEKGLELELNTNFTIRDTEQRLSKYRKKA